MVAVLAHALAVIRRDVFGGDLDPDHAAALALYHDAPEILTGDLPTPVKYYNPEIRAAYREVEEVSARRLLALLPEVLRPAYEPLLLEDPEDPYRPGQGRRQALGLHQVRGGAQGRQRRVPPGGGADPPGPGGLRPPRGGLLSGALPPRLLSHSG